MSHYDALLRRILTEFPDFKVVERDKSWLRRPMAWLAKVTGTNYDGFITTIGSTMYVGPEWKERTDMSKYKVLRHELIHVRQFHRWPFGARWKWINYALFSFCYLFVLPAIWTFRAKFEREGYTQNMLVQFELGGTLTDQEMSRNAEKMVLTFSGPSYFWMSTKKATYAWAMKTQRAINRGDIQNKVDRITDVEAKRAS